MVKFFALMEEEKPVVKRRFTFFKIWMLTAVLAIGYNVILLFFSAFEKRTMFDNILAVYGLTSVFLYFFVFQLIKNWPESF